MLKPLCSVGDTSWVWEHQMMVPLLQAPLGAIRLSAGDYSVVLFGSWEEVGWADRDSAGIGPDRKYSLRSCDVIGAGYGSFLGKYDNQEGLDWQWRWDELWAVVAAEDFQWIKLRDGLSKTDIVDARWEIVYTRDDSLQEFRQWFDRMKMRNEYNLEKYMFNYGSSKV